MLIAFAVVMLLMGSQGVYRAHVRRPDDDKSREYRPSISDVRYVSAWGGVIGGLLIILGSIITGK